MRSTPSLRNFPMVALETVPMLVWLTRQIFERFLFLRLSPPGDRWCGVVGFVPAVFTMVLRLDSWLGVTTQLSMYRLGSIRLLMFVQHVNIYDVVMLVVWSLLVAFWFVRLNNYCILQLLLWFVGFCLFTYSHFIFAICLSFNCIERNVLVAFRMALLP